MVGTGGLLALSGSGPTRTPRRRPGRRAGCHPTEATKVRVDGGTRRAAEQPDEATRNDAEKGTERPLLRRLPDGHIARMVLHDHAGRVHRDVTLVVQVLQGGQPLESSRLSVEHRNQNLVSHV